MKSTPFTYLIGWSKFNRFYYGVRYGKKAHPSTLWTSYFTSSKDVHTMKQEHGEPDIIEIRKTFSDANKARDWEFKVLRRLHAATSEKWLNRREAPAMPIFAGAANPMFGRKHSEETRRLISKHRLGKKLSNEQKIKRSEIYSQNGIQNPFFGKKHSEETKNKIRESVKKNKCSGFAVAKHWKFISPSGNEFEIINGFDKFCADHELSRTKMHLSIGKGKIAPFKGNNMTTQRSLNCIGWSVEQIIPLISQAIDEK